MVLAQEATTTVSNSSWHIFWHIISIVILLKILQTGAEINDINNTGFCCNQTTIHVGNIGNDRYIVQVLSRSIRLLQGARLLHNIQVDCDSPIVQVSICDPYVCAQTQSGAVITWVLRETKGMPRLAMNKNAISSVSWRKFIWNGYYTSDMHANLLIVFAICSHQPLLVWVLTRTCRVCSPLNWKTIPIRIPAQINRTMDPVLGTWSQSQVTWNLKTKKICSMVRVEAPSKWRT